MRAKGEGSIGKRKDGRYYAYLTRTLPSGKTKRDYFYGKTDREVRDELKKAIRRRDDGLPAAKDRETVAEYLSKWLSGVRNSVRPRTYESYQLHVNKYIIPNLGGVQLVQLSFDDVQTLLDHLAAGKIARTKDGKPRKLAPSTVLKTRAVLGIALKDAMRQGRVNRNAASLAKSPRQVKPKLNVWTASQTRTFLDAIKGDRFEAFYVVAFYLGMRRGEIFGLRWSDVDLDKGVLLVTQALQRYGGKLNFVEVKTESANRGVKLPGAVVAALRAHRDRQRFERERAGEHYQDNDLVFTTFKGTPYEPSNIRRSFARLLKAHGLTGLPRLRIHDMRHTSGTIALAKRVPVKTVSRRLGHSSTRITLDIYAHVLDEMAQEEADVMDDALGGEGTGTK